MKIENFKLKNFFYLFTTLLFISISNPITAYAVSRSGAATSVTANIPSKVDIRLFGYTAPNSLVQATSIRVFAQVSSDKTGYFIIDPLPVSADAKEICLTTIDAEKRTGFPLCIGMPDIVKPTEIGPVLLAPTLSLSGNSLIQSQKNQSAAYGKSLPEVNLEISFFEKNNTATAFNLIPPVEAKTIARITTQTDETGSYSINLPAIKATSYRLFARSFYNDMPTPNSQTLSYQVVSYQNYWLRNILPKILLLMIFFVILLYLLYLERKTGKGRIFIRQFREKQLKQFGVRSFLRLRRIWYDLQELRQKGQT